MKFTKKNIFLCILITFLAFTSVYLGVQFAKLNQITTLDDDVLRVLDEPPMRGKMNLLLLGVDEGGNRSDTIMVVSVDNVKNDIKLLSIPRDTKITLNNGKSVKMNALIGFPQREELVIETIKTITKMPIHYYCEVDFNGFIEIIDILGGVDYDVPFDMDYDDPAQDLHIHLKQGFQHLDGKQAHDFVRFRHNNKGAEVYAPGDYYKGDIGRIGAQQAFLSELFRQKMQPQYVLKAPELLTSASKHVQSNFTISSALEFISMLKSTETNEIQSFILPGEGKYIGKVSYYVYSPSETKKLVLEEFGYPEDEAKKLEEKTSSTPSPSVAPVVSAGPAKEDKKTASSTPSATSAATTRMPAESID